MTTDKEQIAELEGQVAEQEWVITAQAETIARLQAL